MKDLGKGLATLGIWLGVGLTGWQAPDSVSWVALMAMFGTLWVWGN